MKIKISKRDSIITVLCLYFVSKLLWDSFTIEIKSFGTISVFEIISLMLISYGIFRYFCKELHYEYASVIVLFIVFSAYILVDCFFKVSAQYTTRAVYEYIFYSAMIFSLGYYLGRCNIEKVVRKIHMFGLCLVALSWYEYITKSYLIGNFENTILYHNTEYIFRSAVFSRSYLSHGVILGFIALCAFYLFLKTSKKKYFVSTVFCWISILTTSSRGPLVATFCALVAAFIINEYRKNKRLDRRVMIWIGICG